MDRASVSGKKSTIYLLPKLGKIMVICASLIALGNLLGRAFYYDFLIKISPGHVITMNPLSSICFVLLGIALWIRRDEEITFGHSKLISKSLAVIVALTAFTKLVFLALGLDLKLDLIMFREQMYLYESQAWNSMAPNTAFSFLLLSITVFYIDKKFLGDKNPIQYINYLVTFVALLSLYGYIYGVKYLYGVLSMIPMSFFSALSIFLFSLSVLFLRPNKGGMKVLIGENPTEVVLLRFAALILPLIIGYLKMQGEKLDIYDKEFGTAVFAALTYAITMILLGRKSSVQFNLRTAKKRLEDARREETERLNYIFDHSSAAIYIRDKEGKFLFVNSMFEEIFEKTKQEIIGTSPENHFSSELSKWFNRDEEVAETGVSTDQIERVQVDGKAYDLGTKKFPIKRDGEEVYLICGIANDLTALRNYEREILENNKMIHTIIELIAELVFVVNNEGDFILFNEKAKKLLGHKLSTYDQIVESKFYYADGVTPYPMKELSIARAFRGLSTRNLELFITNPNFPEGKIFKVLGEPIELGEKQVFGVAIYRDITKRRKFQQKIKEDEERIKDILTTIGEGVIIANPNGKFLQFNSKAIEILGKGPAEINPKEWPEFYGLYYPDGKTLYPSEELALTRALRGETVIDEEHIIITDDKEVKQVLVSANPIYNEKDEIIAGVLSFTNISKIRHIEEAKQEIEEKYRSVMEFIENEPH